MRIFLFSSSLGITVVQGSLRSRCESVASGVFGSKFVVGKLSPTWKQQNSLVKSAINFYTRRSVVEVNVVWNSN